MGGVHATVGEAPFPSQPCPPGKQGLIDDTAICPPTQKLGVKELENTYRLFDQIFYFVDKEIEAQ